MSNSLLVLAAILSCTRLDCSAWADDKPNPLFTISKETTYFTGPLTKDGTVDYATAINRRLSRGVTPENNAAVLFYRATGRVEQPEGFFRILGVPVPRPEGDYFLNLNEFLEQKYKIGLHDKRYKQQSAQLKKHQESASSRPWVGKQHPRIFEWLKRNEKALALVVQGTKRPQYYSPFVPPLDRPLSRSGIMMVLLLGVEQTQYFARALTARAMLRLSEGDAEAAWQDLLACHRLGRLVGRGPSPIETIVGYAIEAQAARLADVAFLQYTKPTARQVAGYLRDLEALPPMPEMARKFDLGDRCMILDTALILAHGGASVLAQEGLRFGELVDQVLEILLVRRGAEAVNWDIVLRMINRRYDEMVAAYDNPSRPEMLKAMTEIETKRKQALARFKDPKQMAKVIAAVKQGNREESSKLLGEIFANSLIPDFSIAKPSEDNHTQMNRNLRVAFALAAFQSDRGHYPKKLGELSPKYLRKVPIDLFTGKPLIYRPSKTGYLLYSAGTNGKDDQGHWHTDTPKGDDPRVRMPLPDTPGK